MTWSERFAAHLTKRGLSQLDAVVELRAAGLRASTSQVHYWCRGSVPRSESRDIIAAWSGGDVPAETTEESGPALPDDTGEHLAVPPSRASTA